MPTTGELLQLIGQAPRHTGDFWTDVKNFFFASAEDDFITHGNKPLLNCENISGLTFTPGGIVQNLTAQNAFEPVVKAVNFGQTMTLLTTRFKFQTQAYLTTFNEGGNSLPGGVRIGYWLAWGGNVRYSRVKTAQELGYRLVVDLAEDKVNFEAPEWTNSDPSRYKELITNRDSSTPYSEDTSLERGIALRYANREHEIVTESWSTIVEEAQELRGYMDIDSN